MAESYQSINDVPTGVTLRIQQMAKLFGMSLWELRQIISSDAFPKPLKLGAKMRLWKSDDVLKWWENFPNG